MSDINFTIFSPYLGEWNFDYYDDYEGSFRQREGSWSIQLNDNCINSNCTFSNGDCYHSTATYNSNENVFDVVCQAIEKEVRLSLTRVEDKLVAVHKDNDRILWVFSEYTGTTFQWQEIYVQEDGSWKIMSDLYAEKIRND